MNDHRQVTQRSDHIQMCYPSLILIIFDRLPHLSLRSTHFLHASLNSSRRNCHYNRKHSTDLVVGNTLLLGHAKVMLQSRNTSNHHGTRDVDHEGCLRFKDIVMTCRIVEIRERLVLLVWQHHPPSFFVLRISIYRDFFNVQIPQVHLTHTKFMCITNVVDVFWVSAQ